MQIITRFILLPIFVWGVFFTANANPSEKYKQLAKEAQWLNLLHYDQNFWGDTYTRADKMSFFLSPLGDENEYQELITTIEKFSSQNRFEFICKFPARYKFLKNHGVLQQNFNWQTACPKLSFFRDQLKAKSISMIFSSYYVNTPASAFGHTLLRFNKSSAEKNGYELLDRAINYAATVTTSNSLIYAVLGMTGGFFGEFSMLPYFYKLREYNDYESRDLWSYELDFNEKEIMMLIDHLWEMKQTLFRYYYATENCSYYMLALLDVIRPELKFLENSKTYIIPGDTILALEKEPGLIKKVGYRPSSRNKMYQRYLDLSKDEKKAFKSEDVTGLSPKKQARVIDALIENYDFKYSYKVLTNDPEFAEKKRQLLIKRSKLNFKPAEVKIEPPMNEAPHNAHGSTRVRMYAGDHQQWGSLYGIELRYALHDKSDPPLGYSSKMEIDFGRIAASFTGLDYQGEDRKRVILEGFDLVRVASHSPWTRFFKDFSWEFRAGLEGLEQLNAPFHLSPGIDLNLGYYFAGSKLSTGFYMKTKAQTSSVFDKGYSFRVGPMWRAYYLDRYWSLGVKFEALLFYPEEKSDMFYSAEAIGSFHLSKNAGLFLKWDWAKAEAFSSQRNRYWAGVSLYY